MQDKFGTEYKNFKKTIQKLSLIEKILAGIVFFVALLIPLPGTGPASIIMITAYVRWKMSGKNKK
jgi:hypothetical protein